LKHDDRSFSNHFAASENSLLQKNSSHLDKNQLEGDQLIAHGINAADVFAAADASGVEQPFLLRVEDPDGPPFAGV
jgi:hypothetical protein